MAKREKYFIFLLKEMFLVPFEHGCIAEEEEGEGEDKLLCQIDYCFPTPFLTSVHFSQFFFFPKIHLPSTPTTLPNGAVASSASFLLEKETLFCAQLCLRQKSSLFLFLLLRPPLVRSDWNEV